MMDFEKLKFAVEEIQLSDTQKEEIKNICSGKKKNFNYKALVAAAAAVAIVIAVFSPGFLIKTQSENSSADMAPQENDFYDYCADCENVIIADSTASALSEFEVFAADGYRRLYSVIPSEFMPLVDFAKFEEWAANADAADGAAIMQFINHFGISREAFETANKNFAKRIYEAYGKVPVIYPDESTQHLEIFNTEIIFSFDKEKIREYYEFPDFSNSETDAVTVDEDYYS